MSCSKCNPRSIVVTPEPAKQPLPGLTQEELIALEPPISTFGGQSAADASVRQSSNDSMFTTTELPFLHDVVAAPACVSAQNLTQIPDFGSIYPVANPDEYLLKSLCFAQQLLHEIESNDDDTHVPAEPLCLPTPPVVVPPPPIFRIVSQKCRGQSKSGL